MPRRDKPRAINPFGGPLLSPEARARIEARRDPSKRNKRRSDVPGTAPLLARPLLTAAFASEFVKMLHAGIPPLTALAYFGPSYYDSQDREGRLRWLSAWERDPLMATASVAHMKGQWQDLDPDSRLELSLSKHMAELAYLLYSTDYASADGTILKKLDTARDAIMHWIAESDEDVDSPYVRALKDLLEGKLHDSLGPPQLGTPGVAIPVPPRKKES